MPTLPEQVFHRRLDAELDEMRRSGYEFSVSADKTKYEVTIRGKALQKLNGMISVRETHKLEVLLNRAYPYAGGIELAWLTPIFHPNIRERDGRVCIQLINEWAASQTIASVINAVQQLLENPNPLSPLNKEAAQYFIENPGVLQRQEPRKPKILGQR